MRKPQTKFERETIEKYEEVVKKQVNKLDPLKLLSGGAPQNEYKKEIREITLRLPSCKSFLDISEIMYIIFAYNFNREEAKPESQYLKSALQIARKMEFNP